MSHYSGTKETWSTSTNSVVNSLRALIDFLDSVRYCIWLWENSFLISRRLIGQPHYFPFLCHDFSLDNPITFLISRRLIGQPRYFPFLYHDVSLDNLTSSPSYITTSHWTVPLLSFLMSRRLIGQPHYFPFFIGQNHYFPFLCHDVSLDSPTTFPFLHWLCLVL